MITPTQSHIYSSSCRHLTPNDPGYSEGMLQTVAKLVLRNGMSFEGGLDTFRSDYLSYLEYDALYDHCITLASEISAMRRCVEYLCQYIEDSENKEK